MAAEDFFDALAQVGFHVGMKLMRKGMEPSVELDRAALANAIILSAADGASRIVKGLGLLEQVGDRRGNFGKIVGIIADEMFGLARAITNENISLDECTLDTGDVCVQATMELRRQVSE